MTAEILIMNQNAVAMASDSAATFSGGGTQKIRNQAIKLFSLSKYAPVGVMIYNQSSLLMYPWETLIKEFRAYLGTQTFDYIDDYLQKFISWLCSESRIFDNGVQVEFFKQATYDRFHGVFNRTLYEFVHRKDENMEPNDFLLKILKNENERLENKKFCDPFNEEDEIRLIEEYSSIVKEIVDKVISEQGYPDDVDNDVKKEFLKYAILQITRDEFQQHYTGFIVAGFGDYQFLPSYSHIKIGRVFDNKIRMRTEKTESITLENRVTIRPFAQTDVVETIMDGIAPDVRYKIIGNIIENSSSIIQNILQYLHDNNISISQEIREGIWKKWTDNVTNTTENILEHVNQVHSENFRSSITLLPKEELASIAETLVELTSFKRRVSTDVETVGGPVDVMVITKGDGLIWVKRKHYFDPKLNHHFFRNYFYDTEGDQ